MYKVMIIDDEKSLRSLLKLAINWTDLGLEVAGEAASGIEAINIIDDVKPDIVFVDIRMPFMDGIEFSTLAIKQYPDLKIIILTAFDDFEYARKCIGIGVCEYLMKPIVRTDIIKTLENIIAKLNAREPKSDEKEEDFGIDVMSATIHKICIYIQENYINSELNLTFIANMFCFNSSYLCRRFKSETGMSFVDYLTKCRMEKAIELAEKKMMMYIAAKQVGIPDPNYFSKCFKKYTGKTYSDISKGTTT